ncbi:hypothetical protein ACLOJK_025940 [Asimina triloba]
MGMPFLGNAVAKRNVSQIWTLTRVVSGPEGRGRRKLGIALQLLSQELRAVAGEKKRFLIPASLQNPRFGPWVGLFLLRNPWNRSPSTNSRSSFWDLGLGEDRRFWLFLGHGRVLFSEKPRFLAQDSSGKDVDLSIYKGKVLLVVNVASRCGFTNKNYTQLTELHDRLKGKDFEILAFPCNQFLKQEPLSSEAVKEFACTRFRAEYPVFQKICVNGPKAAPVYKFLKAKAPFSFTSRVKWNFTKFLVDKEGKVLGRYGAGTPPLAIEDDIKKAIGDI